MWSRGFSPGESDRQLASQETRSLWRDSGMGVAHVDVRRRACGHALCIAHDVNAVPLCIVHCAFRECPARFLVPRGSSDAVVRLAARTCSLTNLSKPFWPELGITKGDLLQYYADVSPVLLPHIATARW